MSIIDDLRFLDRDTDDVLMVEIPVQAFVDLIETQTRVKVLLDFIAIEKSVTNVTIATMLGNSELATQLEEESRKFWEEYDKKKEGEKNEDTESNC